MPTKLYNYRIIEYPSGLHITKYEHFLECDNSKDKTSKISFSDSIIDESEIDLELFDKLEKQKHDHNKYISMIRSKNNIYKLIRNNVWNWFITFTISDPDIRYDYSKSYAKLSQWLKMYKFRYNNDLKYIFVPEQHKDGAWHFHGLISNEPDTNFYYNNHKQNGYKIYNWLYEGSGADLDYKKHSFRYGYNSATIVKNTDASAKYILKYMLKSFYDIPDNHNRYIRSDNLVMPVEHKLLINDDKILYQLLDIADFSKSEYNDYNSMTFLELNNMKYSDFDFESAIYNL